MRSGILLFVLCAGLGLAPQGGIRLLGDFEPGWRKAWREEPLGGDRNVYRVTSEGAEQVLRIDSRAAASALYRPLEAPLQASRVTWRWKVSRSLGSGADERDRSGDDYAARLFVIFGSGTLDRSARALCYVWAASQPVGSSYRSPVVDGVVTIVLQRGDGRAGEWVVEERDFVADYLEAFGAPPEPLASVAIMVDTDDTGDDVTAWFDDLVVR